MASKSRSAAARVAVFPGSFDPIHAGHLDLVWRSRRLFDRLVVAVLNNESKRPVFTVAERLAMLRGLFARDPGIEVESFSGLLVDYAERVGARAIVRGLRSGADLDYETPMTTMNRRMKPGIDTVFLFPSPDLRDISSTLIKEVCRLGGNLDGLVPAAVRRRLEARLRPAKGGS